MLVLGRKINESVVIGDEIIVTVLSVDGDRVKIGIEAPPRVRILRQELHAMVREANLEASKLPREGHEEILSSISEALQMRVK